MLKPVNDVFTPLKVPTFSPNAIGPLKNPPTGAMESRTLKSPFANPGNAWDSSLISALDWPTKISSAVFPTETVPTDCPRGRGGDRRILVGVDKQPKAKV